MDAIFKRFLESNFDNYKAPDFLSEVQKSKYSDSVIRLMEIKKIIDEAIRISEFAQIPLLLIKHLENVANEFEDNKKLLNDTPENFRTNLLENNFERIKTYHSNFFSPSSSNEGMTVLNAIFNYKSFYDSEEVSKFKDLNNELENKNKRVDEILLKLENPSAEKVLSDYAEIYATQESVNNRKSRNWIISGIISTIVFIALIYSSIYFEWFPNKLKLETISNGKVNSHEIINVPVIFTKVLLISLLIYVIVFCFKQFSVYKHLGVINEQRKNAFNSYTLFAAAVGGSDQEAKKALLLSLAKTIHESVNTGFISSKQTDQPLVQNVDVGKLLTGNLPQ